MYGGQDTFELGKHCFPNLDGREYSDTRRTRPTRSRIYFKYSQEARRLIYTTNTIEGFSRQLRKVTKAPTDDSLLKKLYLAMMDIIKKQTAIV